MRKLIDIEAKYNDKYLVITDLTYVRGSDDVFGWSTIDREYFSNLNDAEKCLKNKQDMQKDVTWDYRINSVELFELKPMWK